MTPAAAGLVTIGCATTPVDLGSGASIARTCASWDGANAALWVEGTNLAQEFTAVGSATFNILGYALTIEAQAGIRQVSGGGWEAFLSLTQPFQWGPLTAPLEVAPDGSKVTIWLLTERQHVSTTRSDAAAAASALTIKFLNRAGTLRGTVSAPLGLTFGQSPKPPAPTLHPTGQKSPRTPRAATSPRSRRHRR